MKAILLALFLLLATLGFSTPALAHPVMTNYQITPQAELTTQTIYSTGEPFPQAPVKVYAPSDLSKPWMEAMTDAEGRFAFLPDRSIPGEWSLQIGQYDHADALTLEVSQQGIEIAPDVVERAAQGGNRQLLVLGFAVVTGGIGTRLFSRRQKWHWF